MIFFLRQGVEKCLLKFTSRELESRIFWGEQEVNKIRHFTFSFKINLDCRQNSKNTIPETFYKKPLTASLDSQAT